LKEKDLLMSNQNYTAEKEFKSQSYFRLLQYVRPYWKRLTIGILSGMLVGGSLFVALMMIPQLTGVVEAEKDTKHVLATSNSNKNSKQIFF
jgi:subfamily B ATP-binding cassette protein MsbA